MKMIWCDVVLAHFYMENFSLLVVLALTNIE